MFYGGRLLSHLSANDPEVTEFISLRRLNRNIAIVIDSDRSYARQSINETKKRIRDEFDQGPGFAWITKGREIENYIEPKILEITLKSIYPDFDHLADKDTFGDLTQYVTDKGDVKRRVDKVKLAYEVTKDPINLDVLDLRPMVQKLISFINKSNEI